jgi:PAS domain S-box-containing protein
MLNPILRLLRSPEFTDEDKTRSARVLHVVMLSSFALLLAYALVSFFTAPRETLRLQLLLFIMVVVGLCLVLLHRGRIRSAGFIFTAVVWLVMTVAFYFSGGIRAPQFSGYLVVALMAGLLINGRMGIAYALAGSAAGLVFVSLAANGRLPEPRMTHTPFSLWSVYTIYFLSATILLYLATEAIGQALTQSRDSTRALAEKNAELEEIRRSLEEGRASLSAANEELTREIAERQQAEQALSIREEQYRSIVETARDAIYTLDTEGSITSLNPAFEAITGWSRNEVLGTSFVPLVHPDDLPIAVAAFQQVLAGEIPATFEVRVRTKSDKYRNGEFTAAPQWVDGQVVALLGIARDVTERNQAEEMLRQMQKLDSLGVLAGGVAHDFNNLLVAMMGQTSLALLKLRPDHPARGHIDKAVKATERAASLTRQLLAYSGRGQFEMQPLDLNDLIQQNLHLFEVAIPKNVMLHLSLLSRPVIIEADPGQMQQVIMNLLLNGVQAVGEEPGKITVITDQQTIAGDEWQYWERTGQPLTPGSYFTLEIHDTGRGMDEATIARIFDPFFTTKQAGHGLGLAAVQGIVRGHRGGLRVYSVPGKGTTFKLLFPALVDGEVDEIEHRQPAETAVSGTILVIDDETAVLEAVTDILEGSGWQVLTASSGPAGLEIYREEQDNIDLILLDLTMPGMTGEETFRRLRHLNAQARVLLSSGYNEIEATNRFVGKGLVGFIQKPYNAQQLQTIVRQQV